MAFHREPLFLETPSREVDARFERVFKSSINKHLGTFDFIENQGPHWDASAFALDRVDHFRALDDKAKRHILLRTSEDLMREACFIEMAGLSYTARMSLSAVNLEERLFYSLMAAEEAKHFCMLRPYVSDQVLARGPDSFTALVGEIIDSAEREHAIFLVQVLLEGWGISHFSWMAGACTDESLRATFKSILKDEARHHAAGLSLTKDLVSLSDRRVITWLEEILNMVRIGPVRLIQSIDEASGGLSESARLKILEQLDTNTSVRKRLLYLFSLLSSCVDAGVLKRFEDKRLFEPA